MWLLIENDKIETIFYDISELPNELRNKLIEIDPNTIIPVIENSKGDGIQKWDTQNKKIYIEYLDSPIQDMQDYIKNLENQLLLSQTNLL